LALIVSHRLQIPFYKRAGFPRNPANVPGRLVIVKIKARKINALERISIPIADQVKWSLIPGKCLRDLTCNPFRDRMRRYVDPDKISAGQFDDD
jgi:hypothetical protein